MGTTFHAESMVEESARGEQKEQLTAPLLPQNGRPHANVTPWQSRFFLLQYVAIAGATPPIATGTFPTPVAHCPIGVGTGAISVGTFAILVADFPLCMAEFPICVPTSPTAMGTFAIQAGNVAF